MMEKNNGLTNKACETVRQQIFDLDLFPRRIVSDYPLNKELNMGRAPIRQAPVHLENKGLLEKQIGRKDYRVSTIIKEDIRDLFDFWEGIETTALVLSWRNGVTPEQLENLQETVDKMKEIKDAGQTKEHFSYDQQFHNELVALSNDKRFVEAHDEILLQLARIRFLSFLENSLQGKTCMRYQAIIDAIKNQDYERGRQTVTNHVCLSRNDYINLFGDGLSASSLCLLYYFTRSPETDSEEDE